MDILYTLKECQSCEELVYSLRSLANLPHNKVFIVGGCPNNIDKGKIVHIPSKQKGTKWQNSTANVKLACMDERLSDDFILMNDDFFILKPIQDVKIELNLQQGTVKKVYDYYFARSASETPWCRGMRQTGELLKKQGILEPLSYELHIPFVMNKHKLLSLFDIEGVKDINCLHKRTLYGNLFSPDATYMEDVKFNGDVTFNENKYNKFLSCSDGGFNSIKRFLSNKFPKKSVYEKE